MLIDPKITVALAVEDDRVTLAILRNDSGGVLSNVHWDLRKLEHEGYQALCHRVGNAVSRMLAAAHPTEFAKYPLLVPPKPESDDPCGIVLSLIRRSYKEKTSAYVTVIDRFFDHSASELEQTDLPATWQSVRDDLVKSYPL
jgi:hypothetical protein